ncbi:hypothetical protein [Gordonia sp. SND2]|uniref:hypothetical protein n=1 Tax=Gordonia sp. SND2 TaxID=3388659 RepID=UPI00398A7BDA
MATAKTPATADNGVIDVDLDALLDQRAEARGDEGDVVAFQYQGQRWTYRDPETLTDDEKYELNRLTFDVDVAEWYMGPEQYDRFVEAGGDSSKFWIAFKKHQADIRDELGGNPTRSNRSSRRRRKR